MTQIWCKDANHGRRATGSPSPRQRVSPSAASLAIRSSRGPDDARAGADRRTSDFLDQPTLRNACAVGGSSRDVSRDCRPSRRRMTAALLDANVLIALVIAEHEHHDPASTRLGSADGFALCTIVEGALIHTLLRLGEVARTAHSLLAGVRADPRCVFMPDTLSYADTDLMSLQGHRQDTDLYLVELARVNRERWSPSIGCWPADTRTLFFAGMISNRRTGPPQDGADLLC